MEKAYKTMRNAGVCNITIGIIVLVTGLVVGIMAIISGGILLKRKCDIIF